MHLRILLNGCMLLVILSTCACRYSLTHGNKRHAPYAASHNELVGIYWGTFDPPTVAHLFVIEEFLRKKNPRALIVVVNKAEKKRPHASAEHRFAMVTLMLRHLGTRVTVESENEINHDYLRLKHLLGTTLVAIAGQDSLEQMVSTFGYDALAVYDEIFLVARGQQVFRQNMPLAPNVLFHASEENLRFVSSTNLRALLPTSENISRYVAFEVLNYVCDHRLYQVSLAQHCNFNAR